MGYNEAVVTRMLILGLLLLLAPCVNAVELRQEVLTPPYKSLSYNDVTLDITLDQVYNKITPTTSTHYYIFRIHNERANAINLSSVTKQFFIHLVTEGTPSNYKFFDYLGYRTAQEDGNTVYYTSWEETPFSSVYIPAGQTKIYGIGFDISNPFAQGNYNISFTLNGQEYLLDPDIDACGTLSNENSYILTTDIIDRATDCFTIDGANINFDINGHTIDGTGAANSDAFITSNNTAHNVTIHNGTIQQFSTGLRANSDQDNWTIKNVGISSTSRTIYAFGAATSLQHAGWQIINTTLLNVSMEIDPETNITFKNVTFDCLGRNDYGLTINTRYTHTNTDVFLDNCTIRNCNTSILHTGGNDTITTFTAYGGTQTSNISTYEIERGIYITATVDADRNSAAIFKGFTFSGAPYLYWFRNYTATIPNVTLYFVNNTNFNKTGRYSYTTSNWTALLQNYVRFNFTTEPPPQAQTSNFRLNNTLNGEIVNATAAVTGFSNWILVNETKYNATQNVSYNSYTLNSHPSSLGYYMNASILSFTTTGTWNITFYSSTSPDPAPTVGSVTLCNGTACSALGTLYYHNNALNASAVCTDSNTTVIQVKFRYYRNASLYNEYITYNKPFNTTVYANTTVPSTAIVKGDTWTVGANCYDGAQWSGEGTSSGYTVNNTAPTTDTPTLSDYTLIIGDSVTCTVGGYADTDGDAAGTAYYRWWKNGVLVGGVTTQTVNSWTDIGATYGDRVNCSGNQSDSGYSAKNSTEKYSEQAVVLFPPQVLDTNLTLLAGTAITTLYTETALNCSFYVIDNDTATGLTANVRYYDSIDGIVANKDVYNVANATVTWANQTYGATSGQLTKGRNYWCSAKITDGTYISTYLASEQYTVNNTAPVIGVPTINNTNPTNTSIVLCANGTYSDLDSDPVNTTNASWRWFKNTVLVTGFTTQNVSLGASGINASDGDIIICERLAADTGYDQKYSNRANSSGAIVGSAGIPSISLCSSGGFPVLNFSLYDEETLGAINGTMEATFTLYNITDLSVISNTSFTITNLHSFEFCINQYALAVYVDSFQSYYVNITTQEYPQRNYFLLKAYLNASTPQTIPLYLENDTYAKTTNIYLKDQNAKPVAGVYIALQRYYAGTNDYTLVAMAKTNDEGTATTYLRPRDPYYKPIVYYQNGSILQSFTAAPISCDPYDTQCELRLQITPEEAGYYWQYYGKIAYNCSNVNASGVYYVACTFIDTSGLAHDFTLTGYTIGRLINQVCSNTTTTASGTLVCYLPNATGNYHYTLTANINPMLVIGTGEYVIGLTVPFGTFGVFLAAFIIATMGFVGLMTGTPAAVVVLTVVGVIASWAMNLLTFSVSAIVGIVVLGVGLIVLLTRRS